MATSKRALWECPRCGRQFANRNQWHGCTTLTVADCLRGKDEKVVCLFRAFAEAVNSCGPLRVHPTKSRIAFIARMTFASATLKRDGLDIGIMLPYRSHSPRFHKFFPSGDGGVHYLRVNDPGQLDDEVRGWLAEAYRVGKQETVKVAPPPVSAKKARMARPAKRAKTGRPGRLFYLHWNKTEAEERAAGLRALGHHVRVHWSTETTAKLGDDLPEVFVISLDRLPSHGRAYAGWFWEAKKRQGIPIVFCGGQPEKVAVTRKQFPAAVYCAAEEVPQVVADLLGS